MILAVCGGKGGVGKTTVALNLAGELDVRKTTPSSSAVARETQRDSRDDERAKPSRTTHQNAERSEDAVLVDADLGMADVPAGRGPDLHDVLAGRADPVEAVREHHGVRLLPCGRTLAGAREGDPRKLVDAVRSLDGAYGDVVLDCPAGLRADVGLPLLAADACVVVTTPDRAALADALRARSLAVELDAGLAAVAYNRANEPDEAVADALGAPVVAVPEADAVAATLSSGQPVRSLAPAATATEQFERLAARVQSCRS